MFISNAYAAGATASPDLMSFLPLVVIFVLFWFMLIRPQIIRNGADASMVAEELRAKMRGGRMDAVALPAALNVLAKPLQ